MQKPLTNNLLYYNNAVIEWTARFLFSINIVIPGLTDSDHAYPLDVLLIVLIAFWLFIGRLKWLSLFFLLLASLINYQHFDLIFK